MAAMNLADPELELLDPTPNIHSLFLHFDKIFFYTKLNSRAVVRWSKRMYSCAGTCSYEGRGGLCDIALSEPLLKLRPRKDLVETLLHEMIHAFLFVTNRDQNRDGHGPNFRSHMNRINKSAGLSISIYHDFHDEVKLYQTHWWRCEGPCQRRRPYFGIVRRSTNRAPGPSDYWWKDHKRKCGGVFVKIKAPQQKAIGSRRINTNIQDFPNPPPNNYQTTSDESNFIYQIHPEGSQTQGHVPVIEHVRNVWANRQIPTRLPGNYQFTNWPTYWPTNQFSEELPQNNQFTNTWPTNQFPAGLSENNQFINHWPTYQIPARLPHNYQFANNCPTYQIPARLPGNYQFANDCPTYQIPARLPGNYQFANNWPVYQIPARLPANNQGRNNWPTNQVSARQPANFQGRNNSHTNEIPTRPLANNQSRDNRNNNQTSARPPANNQVGNNRHNNQISVNNPVGYVRPNNRIPAGVSVNNIVRNFWANNQIVGGLPANNSITYIWPTNQISGSTPANNPDRNALPANQISASLSADNPVTNALPTNHMSASLQADSPVTNALPTNQISASLPADNPVTNALPTNQISASLPADNLKENICDSNEILAGISANDAVRNIWANKQIPPQVPANSTVKNTSNRNKHKAKDTVASTPAKMKRIDDYFKANATLRDLYGEEYTLPQPHCSNVPDTVNNAHEQEVIKCPVCNAKIIHGNINKHLDECLNREVIESLTQNKPEQPSQHSTNKKISKIDGHLPPNILGVNALESVAISQIDSNIVDLVNNNQNSERLGTHPELQPTDEQVINNIENITAATSDQSTDIPITSQKNKRKRYQFVTNVRGDDIIEVEFTESQRKSSKDMSKKSHKKSTKNKSRSIAAITEISASQSQYFYFENVPGTSQSNITPGTRQSEVKPGTSQASAVPVTSQSSVAPQSRMSANDELGIQKCPCCGKKFDKPVEDHLDECLAFLIDDTWNADEQPSTSYSNNDIVVIDDDEFDESQTLNSTGTKTPCPCCMRMVEETAMEHHLDFCLGKWFD